MSRESEEDHAPRRVLCFYPMSWLGQIRSHRRDESWSASLWQTFFAACVGAKTPALTEVHSRLVVAKSLHLMLLTIMLAPVPPIPEPKRLTIGQSSN